MLLLCPITMNSSIFLLAHWRMGKFQLAKLTSCEHCTQDLELNLPVEAICIKKKLALLGFIGK